MSVEPYAPAELATLDELREQATEDAQASKAQSTRDLYDIMWKDWTRWCAQFGRQALPADPDDVAFFLSSRSRSGLGLSSIRKRRAAIRAYHLASGQEYTPTDHPAVKAVMDGIARRLGPERPVVKASPAMMDDITRMLEQLPEGVRGLRDRAVLLVGFAGARRRSEVAALNLADVREVGDGLEIHIRKSKTNQTGEREVYGLPYSPSRATCPVRSWQAWRAELDRLGVLDEAGGAAFRVVDCHERLQADERMSAQAIARMVRRYALKAGLPAGRWSGHSLRAGFITQADRNGVRERKIAEQSGHKNLEVLRGYIRENDRWRENPAAAVLR